MKRPRRTARQYFEDLLEYTEIIESYIGSITLDEFLADRMRMDAIIRNVEVLGEASRQLLDVLPDAASRFPSIPFAVMYATRNRLIHGYTGTKPQIVYEVAVREIPMVRLAVTSVLANWPADLT